MANWLSLSTSEQIANTLPKIRDLLIDCVTLLKSNPTNPVDGMLRLNRSTWGLEEYDAATTTWVPRPLGFAGGGHTGNNPATARAALELGTVATKNTIITADITDGAVTPAKTSGFGALATKSTIVNADIQNGAVTPVKTSGFGALAFLSSIMGSHLGEPVPVNKGGGGGTTKEANRANWDAAKSGVNTDITRLNGYGDEGWYPGAFYVPSPGASGAVFVFFARKNKVGGWVNFQFHGTINITVAHDVILIELPDNVASSTSAKWQSGGGEAFIPGVGFRAIRWRTDGAGKTAYIKRIDDSNFPAVSGIEINIEGGYAAAYD